MKIPVIVLAATATVFTTASCKDGPTWTDPVEAKAEHPAFSIQGEYGVNAEGQDWGVQVIARGGDRLEAFALEGGLPGRGHTKEMRRIGMTGELTGEGASLRSEDGKNSATIAGGSLTLVIDGEERGELPRIERSSPTLGAKPPEGAVVLFDGSSADEWINGKVVEGLLPNLDVKTKRRFHSYRLHLEFRTPYKPEAKGQARGNSGVYHQHRYETQVLDSFGLTGESNETGGIYKIAAPKVNACLPPLTWQTYDVDFISAEFDGEGKLVSPARMTVHLNGVLVQDDQELPHVTGGAGLKLTPDPGPIFLQHHGNPVFYRNIWIVEK